MTDHPAPTNTNPVHSEDLADSVCIDICPQNWISLRSTVAPVHAELPFMPIARGPPADADARLHPARPVPHEADIDANGEAQSGRGCLGLTGRGRRTIRSR